ncbi:ATP-binding protein [Nocardiopsis sp. CNT-189]
MGRARSTSTAGAERVRQAPERGAVKRHDCEGIAVSGPSLEGAPSGRAAAGSRAAGDDGEAPPLPAARAPGGGRGAWWTAALRAPVPAGGAPECRTEDVLFELPADQGAPAAARRVGTELLSGWGLSEAAGGVELVLSELVTNALRHGLPSGAAVNVLSYGYGNVIRVRLLRRDSEVVCAVHDPGERVPAPREPDLMLETGRGLHLVDCFSRSWGVVLTPPSGKYVWALFG